MERRLITVQVLRKDGSDLLVAFSDELKGLIVHGRNKTELEARIPLAIRSILEADGHVVSELYPLEADTPPGFKAEPRFRYDARLAA